MTVVPDFITFDVFGTIVDWRAGLEAACASAGRPLRGADFDRVVDRQSEIERHGFCAYSQVTRRSLVEVIGLPEDIAGAIGRDVGRWPLFPDSSDALRALMRLAPCAAMTNSDRVHGEQVQDQLGFRLSEWLCAEETRVYKPNVEFWRIMARRRGIEPGPGWWHVSAYADFDLAVAARLGLTTVFVRRAHARPGAATRVVDDLAGLVAMVS